MPGSFQKVSKCLKTCNFTMESGPNSKAHGALVSTKDTKKAPSNAFNLKEAKGLPSCIELSIELSGGMLTYQDSA